jgi:hypothetical protein
MIHDFRRTRTVGGDNIDPLNVLVGPAGNVFLAWTIADRNPSFPIADKSVAICLSFLWRPEQVTMQQLCRGKLRTISHLSVEADLEVPLPTSVEARNGVVYQRHHGDEKVAGDITTSRPISTTYRDIFNRTVRRRGLVCLCHDLRYVLLSNQKFYQSCPPCRNRRQIDNPFSSSGSASIVDGNDTLQRAQLDQWWLTGWRKGLNLLSMLAFSPSTAVLGTIGVIFSKALTLKGRL